MTAAIILWEWNLTPSRSPSLAALSGVDAKEIRTYWEVGLLPSVRERAPGKSTTGEMSKYYV